MTAQHHAEYEREEQAKQIKLQARLINLAHDAIIVHNPEGLIVSWNYGAEKLYGWSEQEAKGHITHTLLQTRFPPPVQSIDHILKEQGQWEGDLIHTCKDSTQVIVESRQVLVRDEKGNPTAILEINRNVTERRRLEQIEQEARVAQEARLSILQFILDALPSGVILVQGHQARLVVANRAANVVWGARWEYGQTMEDFMAQNSLRLFSEDGRPLSFRDTATWRAIISGEPVLDHQSIRHADGSSLPVLVNAIPLDAIRNLHRFPPEITGLLSTTEPITLIAYQDVTAFKEAEALKDAFISLATHELRTPVTIVAGYVDLLLRRAARGKSSGLDDWQIQKLKEMKEATYQLTKLTEDLRDVTSVQTGQFQLQCSPTDLVALTLKVVEQIQATTANHQISIQKSPAHQWATVDAFRIEQVLYNLLSNAIKYSPQGGSIEVTIEENTETHEASFSIRDHGLGIPQKQQSHIFGRFFRADNIRAARIGGTGLGLYLCRELIERHGGRIWFESAEGIGTTFFFTLPCNAEGMCSNPV